MVEIEELWEVVDYISFGIRVVGGILSPPRMSSRAAHLPLHRGEQNEDNFEIRPTRKNVYL